MSNLVPVAQICQHESRENKHTLEPGDPLSQRGVSRPSLKSFNLHGLHAKLNHCTTNGIGVHRASQIIPHYFCLYAWLTSPPLGRSLCGRAKIGGSASNDISVHHSCEVRTLWTSLSSWIKLTSNLMKITFIKLSIINWKLKF